MKLCFQNAEELREAIDIVAADLSLTVTDEANADVVVTVEKYMERRVTVTLDGKRATIAYGDGTARFLRGLATLADWIKSGVTKKERTETPLFKTNGAMVDMSRNAVMNVKTVKTMLRKMALMGLNTYMLYTEDTYEIDGYPYFGYMRGQYTKAELRELDAYASSLGIELIPCVQMLGHLATHLRWGASGSYRDTENALLVGSETTEKLLRAMLDSISECFTTRRIHVGMDETHDLGTGAYLEKYGYKDRQDIYFAHLAKVIDLCCEYGFEPMMWSDMFFRLAGRNIKPYKEYHPDVEFTDDVIARIPKGIQQVFWDYYRPNEDFYTINIDKHHRLFGKDMLFAGGIWTWSGHCPLFARSLGYSIPALNACRDRGVQEIFATIWHNGSEGSLIFGLLGLARYADYDYHGTYDADNIKDCFRAACGVSYDTIVKCEKPERFDAKDGTMMSMTRAYLYNDPMVGLVDKHLEGYETSNHFRTVTELLKGDTSEKGIFASAYDIVVRVSDLLENKADFGIRLKAAYDQNDRDTLRAMQNECDVIVQKVKALWESHRASWIEYNKPFGWEIHDIRYGGILCRFETAKCRILAYLNGEVSRLEELEEERLRFNCAPEDAPLEFEHYIWVRYNQISNAGIL